MPKTKKQWDTIAGIHFHWLKAEMEQIVAEQKAGKSYHKITLHAAHRAEQHLRQLAMLCEGKG